MSKAAGRETLASTGYYIAYSGGVASLIEPLGYDNVIGGQPGTWRRLSHGSP
ncbi:MAG: hypothetical protein KDA61_21425 [Planctomycetales bacterium]|nr:hypothetical protein [Planctomycetales bacterium]